MAEQLLPQFSSEATVIDMPMMEHVAVYEVPYGRVIWLEWRFVSLSAGAGFGRVLHSEPPHDRLQLNPPDGRPTGPPRFVFDYDTPAVPGD